MKMLMGLLLILLALIWNQALVWGNPDMTSWRLILEFPVQFTLIGILAIVGALIGVWSREGSS